MPRVTFIQPDGTSQTIDIPVGHSVMEGAVKHDIMGIAAECGGACACATCHVRVEPEWVNKLAPAQESETAMLDFVTDPDETSRLSCQITVQDAMDGLRVHIPKSQH
jgi:2Fe-2S ferredoxin